MGDAAWSTLLDGAWKRNDAGCERFKVHVDGEPQPLAVAADAMAGTCKLAVIGAQDQVVPGEYRTVRGRVTFVLIGPGEG